MAGEGFSSGLRRMGSEGRGPRIDLSEQKGTRQSTGVDFLTGADREKGSGKTDGEFEMLLFLRGQRGLR